MTISGPARTLPLTALALAAFAGNSLLCRAALRPGLIGAGLFTAVRLASGALALALLVALFRGRIRPAGSWLSALALFAYAAPFSFAYLRLPAGTGALILFGSVQTTMIGVGLLRGERPAPAEWLGLLLALGGLVSLTLPGMTAAPDPAAAALMALAGISWGIYSLRGRRSADPLAATAGNFIRSLLLAAPLLLLVPDEWHGATPRGLLYAALSGAVTSGVGYALWYAALPGLSAHLAAIVQLLVPVLVALAGIALLGESLTLRLAACGAVILGGVALAVFKPGRPATGNAT